MARIVPDAPQDGWYDFDDVVAALDVMEADTWHSDSNIKYIGMRVDTQTRQVYLTDRNGQPLRFADFVSTIIKHRSTPKSPQQCVQSGQPAEGLGHPLVSRHTCPECKGRIPLQHGRFVDHFPNERLGVKETW